MQFTVHAHTHPIDEAFRIFWYDCSIVSFYLDCKFVATLPETYFILLCENITLYISFAREVVYRFSRKLLNYCFKIISIVV